MHRLRSPSTIGPWAVVLGLLLAAAPMMQSPCSRAAGPQPTVPDAVATPVTPGAQASCSEAASATRGRAVSLERADIALDVPPGDVPFGSTGAQSSFVPSDAQLRAPRFPVSPTLDALRAVVLQV